MATPLFNEKFSRVRRAKDWCIPIGPHLLNLAADAEKSHLYETFAKIGGRPNIFTRKTSDHLWKSARKGSAPAFSSREVSRMNSVCRVHLKKWIESTVGQEKEIDPSEEMTKLTFFIVMESAFEYSPTDEEYSSFTENLEVSLREFTFRQSINPLRQLFGIFLPETRRAVKACSICRKFAWKVLKTYRANPNKSPQNTLIKLIDENSTFDDDLKVSELITYMVAGFDTTGYTLSSTLVLLAKHPDLVKKARASIKEDGQMTTTIQHILAESNRFYPVAAMGSIRTLPRDMTAFDRVSQRKYVIPKGSNCFLPQYLPNRNKAVWGEDADVFRPDRWEHATQEMNDARLIFAFGSRNCIGQSLAVAELQSVLPRLIQDYDFELVEKGNLNYFLTLKFHDSKIKLTKV